MKGSSKIGGRSRAHWDALLTDRSKKFYDGTYQWNGSDGYWDERQVYHRFNDENDPEGQPPTPRPVSPVTSAASGDELDTPYTISGMNTPKSTADSEAVTDQSMTIQPLFSRAALQNTDDKIIVHLNGTIYKPTVPREDLYAGKPNRERLLGRLEGSLVGQWAEKTGLGLKECYKLCAIKDKEAVLAVQAIDEWKEEARLRGGGEEEDNDPSSENALSECPSDLSDWDFDDELMKKPNVPAGPKAAPMRKEVDRYDETCSSSKKAKNFTARVVPRDRISSCDPGIVIPDRRRSARHLGTAPVAYK